MDQFQSFKLENLLESGYKKDLALNALNIWDWDLSQARNFLASQGSPSTGQDDELKRALEMSKSQDGISQYQIK
jgi:hypothetical protein